MRDARAHRRAAGFTLIELMLVVAIISIMTAMAIGFTTDWRRRSTFHTVARELYNGLSLARANAIKRGRTVKMSIVTSPNNALYVFIDGDDSNTYSSGGDSLLYTFPTDPEDWPMGASDIDATIDATLLAANASKPVLIFDAYGLHVDVNGEPLGVTPANGAILVEDTTNGDKLYVDVTIAGALRVRDE